MASAGTVNIAFVAEVARFNASLKTVQASLGRLESGFSSAGRALKGFIGTGTAVAALTAITKATAESEAAIAQLDSALKNAGATVGGSSKAFQDFAAEMQRVTTFTDEAVLGVESILLSFKGLSGGTVLAATEAVLDLSTRLKVDLTSAAKLVGKALADPEKGLTALSRAGVVFTEQQRGVINALLESGRTAEAQKVILDSLADRFGGAAKAARDTFGGALIGVKNAFGDLLEAKSGMPGVTRSLNALADTLNDPATKAGFDSFLEFLATAATIAATAAGAIGSLFSVFKAEDEIGRIIEETKTLQNQLASIAGNETSALQERERILRALLVLERERAALAGRGGPSTRGGARGLVVPGAPEEQIDQDRLNRIVEIEMRISQLKNKLALEEFDRLTKEFEEGFRLEEERAERIMALETSIAERRRQLALDEFDKLSKEFDDRVRLEEKLAEDIKAIKQGAVNDAIGFLQLLGARSKTAAKAAFQIQKGIAIAETIISTHAAAMQALKIYGPTPIGYGAAAAAIAYGAARVAAISATAIEGTNQIQSGARLGTPANPVFTQTPQGGQADFGATSQSAVQVIVSGNVGWDQSVIDKMVAALREAVDGRDVIIFGPDSLQAQQLVG